MSVGSLPLHSNSAAGHGAVSSSTRVLQTSATPPISRPSSPHLQICGPRTYVFLLLRSLPMPSNRRRTAPLFTQTPLDHPRLPLRLDSESVFPRSLVTLSRRAAEALRKDCRGSRVPGICARGSYCQCVPSRRHIEVRRVVMRCVCAHCSPLRRSGHTDHSEPDLQQPLFSLSLGHAAVFMIGGHTREEQPEVLPCPPSNRWPLCS
jgi:hypothetical protein